MNMNYQRSKLVDRRKTQHSTLGQSSSSLQKYDRQWVKTGK